MRIREDTFGLNAAKQTVAGRWLPLEFENEEKLYNKYICSGAGCKSFCSAPSQKSAFFCSVTQRNCHAFSAPVSTFAKACFQGRPLPQARIHVLTGTDWKISMQFFAAMVQCL